VTHDVEDLQTLDAEHRIGPGTPVVAGTTRNVTDPIRRTVADQVGGLPLGREQGVSECQLRPKLRPRGLWCRVTWRPSEHRAWSTQRRMRDSNPRRREPKPLSKSANRCSGLFGGRGAAAECEQEALAH
jgi:hypothetical protein